MIRITKRAKENAKLIDREKTYKLDEAMEIVGNLPKAKFDETVELHFHLNVNAKSAEQLIRGNVSLPHGLGKDIRVAVFAKGEQASAAKEMSAEHVGDKDLIEKVSKGFLDFDCVIATPDMMRDLSKLGRVLGPRGLMPSPKSGTVTTDVAKAIKDVKAGRVEFKSDKQSGIHVGIGKKSFEKQKLVDNAKQVIDAVSHSRPSALKGNMFKSLYVSTTMGPGMRIDA